MELTRMSAIKQKDTEELCLCSEHHDDLTNDFFFEEHNHMEEEQIIVDVLHKIAAEQHKSPQKIKHLLLDQPNNGIIKRFWEILDETIPGHDYMYVGYCCCGCLDLLTE